MDLYELQYKRCAFYVRYYNLKMKTQQLLSIMNFCHKYGILLGYSSYFEDRMKNEATKKGNFYQLLKLAEMTEIEAIIVYNGQIIDLDFCKFESYRNQLNKYGVEVVSLQEVEGDFEI